MFGYYECPTNETASRLLLDAARVWLHEQGMSTMRGPWSFVSQEWGAVVEGFEPQPVILAPYNPPYYIDQFDAYGLKKNKRPFGWLKLILGLPKLTHYRLFALGVTPEYHGKAVDSLIYRALYESCFSPDIRMEINYVLEDNGPMNNAIVKLGAKPLRRYRIFEMPAS